MVPVNRSQLCLHLLLALFSAYLAVEIEEGQQANASVMKELCLYIGPYCAVTSGVLKI